MLMMPPVDEHSGLNSFPIFYWNHVALELNRATHSLAGPQGGPTMSSRALGLVQLAMHDAFFGVVDRVRCYRAPPVPAFGNSLLQANQALTGAAITILDALYAAPSPAVSKVANEVLRSLLRKLIDDYQPPIAALSPEYLFGAAVAQSIHALLGVKPGEIGADAGRYEPSAQRYRFRDEPLNPVRRVPIDPDAPERGTRPQFLYHGPFYGSTVPAFAVTDPAGHTLRPPPHGGPIYDSALEEVIRLGGAPGERGLGRSADGTAAAYFWAYDGANLIGTPPRLYNQIVRKILWERATTHDPQNLSQTAEFVRLLALINVAMADAGKFAWLEKYKYEFWRPLAGVREHDPACGPEGDATGSASLAASADPFWKALGAPETNSNKIAFKPPFPAYPSGHATFGAACFQMVRLFYRDRTLPDAANPAARPTFPDPEDAINVDYQGPEGLEFTFVSEELNGLSRDLYQPYDGSIPLHEQPGEVRTRLVRRFESLWHAIFENAFSRIWLGVHWNFDAFDPEDRDPNPANMRYGDVWTAPRAPGAPLPTGGVPLGLGIANDIYRNGMRQPAVHAPNAQGGDILQAKLTPTNIR